MSRKIGCFAGFRKERAGEESAVRGFLFRQLVHYRKFISDARFSGLKCSNFVTLKITIAPDMMRCQNDPHD